MKRTTPEMFRASSDDRNSVIERQRLIEEEMPSHGVVIFFVPSMLTPLFIAPSDIQRDGDLFVLKLGAVLPEGLIPSEKANDPAQLSSVLGRTLSMRRMLDSGVKIIVLSASEHRAQTNDQAKFVSEREIDLIKQRYSENFNFHVVSNGVYQQLKNDICAATYCNGTQVIAIRASQIHQANTPTTEVVQNPDVRALQTLLEAENIPHSVIQSAQLRR